MKYAILLLLAVGAFSATWLYHNRTLHQQGMIRFENGAGSITVRCTIGDCSDIEVESGIWEITRGLPPAIANKHSYRVEPEGDWNACYDASGKVACAWASWPECKLDGMEILNLPCRDSGGHYFESHEGGPDKKKAVSK